MPKLNTQDPPIVAGTSRLEEIARKRAEMRAALSAEREEQQIKDLEEVLALEIKYGPERVQVKSFEHWARGTVTLFVVRAPDRDEIDQYRHHLKASRRASKQGEPDVSAATIQIGLQCLVYPHRSTPEYEAMISAYAGCDTQIGTAALELSLSVEEAEGKA